MAKNKENEKMGREEAGRKGGETTSKNQSKEFFQEIGEKGGKASNKNSNN
ncbi:general stress protein B [Bacillus aryabhattai]|nr:KGG domain-containing protein [Priestia aryabhattai]MBE5098486.1 general stress protein B [Priestia aryabhattai]